MPDTLLVGPSVSTRVDLHVKKITRSLATYSKFEVAHSRERECV